MGDNSGSKASPGAANTSPPIGYDPGRFWVMAHGYPILTSEWELGMAGWSPERISAEREADRLSNQ